MFFSPNKFSVEKIRLQQIICYSFNVVKIVLTSEIKWDLNALIKQSKYNYWRQVEDYAKLEGKRENDKDSEARRGIK
jgi:hypothetical protein